MRAKSYVPAASGGQTILSFRKALEIIVNDEPQKALTVSGFYSQVYYDGL
jgi:hypothetical protein